MDKYLEGHNNCGLKEGDVVKVTKKAKDFEGGWGDVWLPDKTTFVGKVGIIVHDYGKGGFHVHKQDDLGMGYNFPYFVLQKVEKDGHEEKKKDVYKEKYIKLLVDDCHRYCCPRSHIGFVHCPFGEDCSLIAFEDWERYLDGK